MDIDEEEFKKAWSSTLQRKRFRNKLSFNDNEIGRLNSNNTFNSQN